MNADQIRVHPQKSAAKFSVRDRTLASSRSCCKHLTAATALPNRQRKDWRASSRTVQTVPTFPSIPVPPIEKHPTAASRSVPQSCAPRCLRCAGSSDPYPSLFVPLSYSSFLLLDLLFNPVRYPIHIRITMTAPSKSVPLLSERPYVSRYCEEFVRFAFSRVKCSFPGSLLSSQQDD